MRAAQMVREARRLIVQGHRKKAVDLLNATVRAHPTLKTPRQLLCGVLPQIGRLREALKQCQGWAKRETNPAYKTRAVEQVEQIKESLGQ